MMYSGRLCTICLKALLLIMDNILSLFAPIASNQTILSRTVYLRINHLKYVSGVVNLDIIVRIALIGSAKIDLEDQILMHLDDNDLILGLIP